MSYFLIKKCWDAVAIRLGEDTDAPCDFDSGAGTASAYVALESIYARYKFITAFIARRDGSCSVNDFELVFLTVCPPDTVDLAAFRTRIEGFIGKTKSIKRWMLAYEQRGTLDGHDLGRGRHCHLILDIAAPTSFANFKRAVGTQFRPWIWDCRAKLRSWESDKVSYLQGSKDPSKAALVEGDCAWRISEHLEPTYQSESWAT